jgi:hypothetical protein
MLEQRIAEDLSVRQQMEQMEAFTRKYIASADKSTGTVIIPIVVHVVHNGETVGTYPNMSDAQINSAIVNLNQAFQNTASMIPTFARARNTSTSFRSVTSTVQRRTATSSRRR